MRRRRFSLVVIVVKEFVTSQITQSNKTKHKTFPKIDIEQNISQKIALSFLVSYQI